MSRSLNYALASRLATLTRLGSIGKGELRACNRRVARGTNTGLSALSLQPCNEIRAPGLFVLAWQRSESSLSRSPAPGFGASRVENSADILSLPPRQLGFATLDAFTFQYSNDFPFVIVYFCVQRVTFCHTEEEERCKIEIIINRFQDHAHETLGIRFFSFLRLFSC